MIKYLKIVFDLKIIILFSQSFYQLLFYLHAIRVVPCNFSLSPVSGLVKNLYNSANSDYGDINLDKIISFTKAFPSKRSFNFCSGFSDSYPLHQLNHVNSKLPYKSKVNSSIKPNLIVIFAEGFPRG